MYSLCGKTAAYCVSDRKEWLRLTKVPTCWVGCIVVFACSGRRVAVSAAPGGMFTLKSFLLIQLAYRTAPDGGALVIKAFRSSDETFNSLHILSFFIFFFSECYSFIANA